MSAYFLIQLKRNSPWEVERFSPPKPAPLRVRELAAPDTPYNAKRFSDRLPGLILRQGLILKGRQAVGGI